MADCRDYQEILLGESLDSLDSNDSSPDWEPSGETLGSQDTWSSQSSEDSSQDSFLDSSQDCEISLFIVYRTNII